MLQLSLIPLSDTIFDEQTAVHQADVNLQQVARFGCNYIYLFVKIKTLNIIIKDPITPTNDLSYIVKFLCVRPRRCSISTRLVYVDKKIAIISH